MNTALLEKLIEENIIRQKFSMPDFLEEMKSKWDDEEFYFDEIECQKIYKYICLLRNDKGTSKHFKPLKFQMEIICEILCVKSRASGLRRFREAHINIPRKNGKSFIVAIIMSYLFFHQKNIFGALFIITANTTKQANELFNTFLCFVNGNRALKRRCKIWESTKTIKRKDNDNKLIILSNDGSGADSYADYCAALDEIHEYKSDEIYGKLKTGQGIWDDPLTITITTASSGEDITNLETQLYTKCQAIENGEAEGTNKSFYYRIYEAEKECEIDDVEQWFKANPALGMFRKIHDLIQLCEDVKLMPLQENMFRRMFLNQHVATSHIKNAINMELWNKAVKDITLEEIKEIPGVKCYGGLDLSSVNDITAFVLVFYDPNRNKYIVYPFLHTAKDTATEREKTQKYPYVKWINEGTLKGFDGKYVRFDDVLDNMIKCRDEYNIEKLGYDRFGTVTIQNVLEDEFNYVPLGQGTVTMTQYIHAFENLLVDERLIIANNEVFTLMAQNCVAVYNEQLEVKYSKKKSAERFKIDGIIAMLMALGLAVEDNEGGYISACDLVKKLNNIMGG